MEYRSHHVAPTRNLIRRGYHDVLADRKVAQRPAYLDSGPAFVRHITHHNKQVYVAPLVGITSRPGAEEHDARRLEPSNDAIHHDRNIRFRGHRVLSYRLQPSAWTAQQFSDCGLHGVTLRRFPLPFAEFISIDFDRDRLGDVSPQVAAAPSRYGNCRD